jgi:DNA-binding MarR family transcriptional regulator
VADAVAGVLTQWQRARPDLDVWPIGIVGRIMRLSRMWDKEIKELLAAHALEPGEFDVLSTLRRTGPPHQLTAGGFLRSSLVTSGAITLRIDRMEAKGLVERVRVRGDRRQVHIRLTAEGLALVDEVLPLHIANEARLLEGLGADACAELAGLLSALLESSGDVPAEECRA